MPAPVAMISSTVLDLVQHRQAVRSACHVARYFPLMMEDEPARPRNAVDTSLRMVDDCEVLVGLYAWRRGHVPPEAERSITEMELRRAEETCKPVLAFLARELAVAIEPAEADAIAFLHRYLQGAYTVKHFGSPEELGQQVMAALFSLRLELLDDAYQTALLLRLSREDEKAARKAHLGALGKLTANVRALLGK